MPKALEMIPVWMLSSFRDLPESRNYAQTVLAANLGPLSKRGTLRP